MPEFALDGEKGLLRSTKTKSTSRAVDVAVVAQVDFAPFGVGLKITHFIRCEATRLPEARTGFWNQRPVEVIVRLLFLTARRRGAPNGEMRKNGVGGLENLEPARDGRVGNA